jgi:hypothetical protein
LIFSLISFHVFLSLKWKNICPWAGNLISSLTDIPCPNNILGCFFQGTLDGIQAHLCQFQMLFCDVCEEMYMRKDFYSHNMDCFFRHVGNNFTLLTKYCYYLLKGDSGQDEILVKTSYQLGFQLGFQIFLIQSSDQSLAKPSKLKTVIENPDDSSFRMEVVTEIMTGLFEDKRDDFVLSIVKQGMMIHFELIY